MNDIQKVSFDLLKTFIEITNKLNLKWYMVHGSALGAVKYSGFIPWDDDVDVAMPRKDYQIFCSVAQKLLPEYVFLQNYKTDKNFPHTYSKLRNSNTAFIETGAEKLDINHGIYIDIFPLDEYPEGEIEQQVLSKRLKMLRRMQYCALNDTSKKKVILRNKAFRLLGYHNKTAQTIGKIEALITKFNAEGTKWCNHGDRMGQKGCIDKSVYGEGLLCRFEDIDVIVPEKINEYLTIKYGNWKNDPPKNSQNSHHTHVVADAHKSYKEYINHSI